MNVVIREYEEADRLACIDLFREMAQHHAEIYDDASILKAFSEKYFDEYGTELDGG